tara:strand:- start:169 stop:468 length:300 start_codon:yes stop_codon:yes gene_type:complete
MDNNKSYKARTIAIPKHMLKEIEKIKDKIKEDRKKYWKELGREPQTEMEATFGISEDEIKVERKRVKQIEAKTLRKLKHPINYKKLKSFLNKEGINESS